MLDAMRTEAGESEPVRFPDCPVEVRDVADVLTLRPTPANLLALAWAMARDDFTLDL